MYGTDTKAEVTLNLVGDGGTNVIGSLCAWLVVVNPIFKFGITLYPVSISVEKMHCFNGENFYVYV